MRRVLLCLAAALLMGPALSPALAMPSETDLGWSAPAGQAPAPAAGPTVEPAVEPAVEAAAVAAPAPAPAPMRFGMDEPSIPGLAAHGVPPQLASLWAGAWVQTVGWESLEAQLDRVVAADVTPVVHFWYWGDSISPECVAHGCWDALHSEWLSQEGWRAASDGLAQRLAERLQGREAIVVLESEFNKHGIDSPEHAPGFAALLTERAQALGAVPGVRVAIGFGGWGEDRWEAFRPAVEASDLLGFQAMRGSTRNGPEDYAGVADAAVHHARLLRETFGRPVLLTDLALSSHPTPEYEARQADALRALAAAKGALREAGVEGVLYRALPDDPGMDPANYFGEAERHWGLLRADGSAKPALDAWRALVRG